MDYDGSSIEVLKWAEYNPRQDSKKPTWFRLENSIATGASFFALDCEQKWLWIVILSLVSQSNGQPIVWNSAYIENLTGIKKDKQRKTIDIFEKFARLRVSRNVTSRDSHATDVRTNETDVRTNERTASTEVENSTSGAIEIFRGNLEIEKALESVKEETQKLWLSTYPNADWLKQEIFKALAWESVNPKKKSKRFDRFLGNWFARGWEQYRKTMSSAGVDTRGKEINWEGVFKK